MSKRSSNIGVMETPTYIDLAAAAERTGIRYRTLRNYHHRAERHRRQADAARRAGDKDWASYIRPGDLPKPDETFGRSPVWKPATIDQWLASRPGQGKGGGRPLGWSPKKKQDQER